jgi:hypothetical protein
LFFDRDDLGAKTADWLIAEKIADTRFFTAEQPRVSEPLLMRPDCL